MPVSLCLYYIEPKPHEGVGKHWGQLVGAYFQLSSISDVLNSATNSRKMEAALSRLEISLECYFSRIYQLRERVVLLIGAICGSTERAMALKSLKKRDKVLQEISLKFPEIINPLQAVLNALDEDVDKRNTHIHKTFLEIGLAAKDDIYDPRDALMDLQYNLKARKRFEAGLKKAINRMARDYQNKIDYILKETVLLRNVTEQYISN